MAVSRLLPSGGANDFNLNIGGVYTSVTFNKEYASGSYSIISNSADTTFDIYAYNIDGSLAGYTNTGSFTASKGFSKMVVLGGTTNDVLSFSYKTTFVSVDDSDEVTAGPVATSLSTSDLPNLDDTFTLTGRNFATNATVTFTSANTAYPATLAKNLVRNSVTSLTVTRPDNLVVAYAPYTITVQNPGVTNPTGSNSHRLVNAITAGQNPQWSTATTLPEYTRNVAYSTTVVATDDGGPGLVYTLVAGSNLPSGFSLSTAGIISGTTTSAAVFNFAVRVTDPEGNYTDRTFTLPNVGPSWVTSSTLPNMIGGASYSTTVQATDDSGVSPTYSVASGSLPSGLSLNASTGVISGTAGGAVTTTTFTLRATDANGTFSDRSFTINAPYASFQSALTAAGFSQSGLTYTRTTTGQFNLTMPNTAIEVELFGAGGGSGYRDTWTYGGPGGYGKASATASSYGKTFLFTIGGGGAANNGNVGGAGGGGTDIRWNGTSYNERILVAGGGGGGGAAGGASSRGFGGSGGGFGQNGGNGDPNSNGNAQYGLGGTQSAGGGVVGGGGSNGGFGDGGDGGTGSFGYNGGGRGRGTESGGGGGGWYGGGCPGNGNWGGGGGGGSGYINTTYFTNITSTVGGASNGAGFANTGGNGQVRITLV